MPDTNEMPEADPATIADAETGNWVDRSAPRAWRPYLRLSRYDRISPAWLLLLPCWWGVALAALATGPKLFDLWILAGCAIGAVIMRGAGCTWNDITDRDFDGKVERTRLRPIPSGQVTAKQALGWAVIQSLIAFPILLTFNWPTIALGIASLGLVAIYPFAKRFTWWPQVFLGLVFNWGALLAWTAHTGSLSWPPVFLYGAGIAWTLFYDTIYAHQDKEDDALIGVKSTARLFGENTGKWLWAFMACTVILMTIAIIAALLPGANPLALALALGAPWAMGWHMAWQMRMLDIDKPEVCLSLFRSNRYTGFIPLIFLALALLAGLQ